MIRAPQLALRPFVKNLWVSDHARPKHLAQFREHALPDGQMHIVIRLTDTPIRILDEHHPAGHSYGFAVLGGARASFYTREISGPTRAIGATLLPGAAQALFRLNALELANRHTLLNDLWGNQVDVLRERLQQIGEPALQLELFEMYLLAHLPQVKGIHPAVAQALVDIHSTNDVQGLVARSGFSHRRFVELFGSNVGLTPKRFTRVLRFQRMLKFLARDTTLGWAELAADAGYSDQSHFNREFREFSGMAPEAYRRAAPDSPGHVLIASATTLKNRRR